MFRNLHPNLQAYVACTLNHRFGVQKSQAEVLVRQCLDQINRIAVSVPYCNSNLAWELTFRLDDLFSPPDVIAMDTAVETIPMKNIPNILPSLGDWCPEKENCLLNLLLQLIDLHRFSQMQRLQGIEDLNRQLFEYLTLTEMGIVAKEDVELSVTHAARGTTVCFYLALHLNLNDLPLQIKDPSDPTAFLTIHYRIPGQTKIDMKISSHLRKLLGQVDAPALHPNTVLTDYVPMVHRRLTELIDACRANYVMKQQVFAAVASRIGTSVLNADSENFSKISFLLTRGNRNSVFMIEFPVLFPAERATVKALDDHWGSNAAPKELKFSFDRKWSADKIALEMLKAAIRSR